MNREIKDLKCALFKKMIVYPIVLTTFTISDLMQEDFPILYGSSRSQSLIQIRVKVLTYHNVNDSLNIWRGGVAEWPTNFFIFFFKCVKKQLR